MITAKEIQTEILRLLRQHGTAKATDLRDILHTNGNRIAHGLTTLLRDRKIRRRKSGVFLYSLAD